MSLLKYRFFGMLGVAWARHDPNKDIVGKGTVERFSEAVWAYWDDTHENLVANIVESIINPNTAIAEMLPVAEASTGIDPYGVNLFYTDYVRRTVLHKIKRLVAIKGTKKCFKILFSMIGFDCEIIEDFTYYSFDSTVTLDDPNRRFDMGKCKPCSNFRIEITSREAAPGTPLTAEQQAAANSIITFCTPINANLTELTIL